MPPKPQVKWATAQHEAMRLEGIRPDFSPQDSRAESFVLKFFTGHQGRADLSLARQCIDAESLAYDPELKMAVRAWLLARGQRQICLFNERGEPVDQGPIAPADFDTDLGPGSGPLASLAPSNFELLEVLGLADEVSACEDSSPTQGRAALGPDLNPDLDVVAKLAPRAVLASLSVPGMERVVMGLRLRKLPALVCAPKSLDDIEADISRVSAALGGHGQAALASFVDKRQKLAAQAATLTRPLRVYLQWWPRPQFSPGADCYSNELIALAGGRNIFADRPGSSLEVQAHDVAAQDPEIAFVSWCGVAADKLDPSRLWSIPELGQTSFAAARRVYPLDEAYSGRPGPNALHAAQLMATQVHAVAKELGLLR